VEAIPMKSVTLKDVINFVKEHAIHRFGIPQTIMTDGGSVFISEEFRKFAADWDQADQIISILCPSKWTS
jgi:hypothetical protein